MLAAVKDEPFGRPPAVLDRSCARQLFSRAGRDGKMSPIEQKDVTDQKELLRGRQHSGQPRRGRLGGKPSSLIGSGGAGLEQALPFLPKRSTVRRLASSTV